MNSHFDPGEPYFQIRLLGAEEAFPTMLDVSNFLSDFNLLYEITRLATDYNYKAFRFSNFVFHRRGRPLDDRDRLHVQALTLESPLLLITALTAVGGAIGSIWGIVQIVEKILNMPLNRRKLRAEVEKLERESRDPVGRGERPRQGIQGPEDVKRVLRIREAEAYYESVGRRLERSTVRLKELEIEVVSDEERSTPTIVVPPVVTPPLAGPESSSESSISY
jgi:hypothetical protein